MWVKRHIAAPLFLALMLVPAVALADGKAFEREGDTAAYEGLAEKAQVAAIAHRDGVQRMLIAVNLEVGPRNDAFWLFPVPGELESVRVDLVDSFPALRGVDPRAHAHNLIAATMMGVRATQFWPLALELLTGSHLGGSRGDDVAVHASAERWGLRAETLTAASLDALALYLKSKGTDLPVQELGGFEPYVSGGYVLVGVWIASPRQVLEEFPGYRRGTVGQEGRWPCVYVEFPAEQPFYPLLATSTYGHEQMQIDLYVIGWVAPDGARGGDWFQAAGGRWRHYWQEQLPEGTAAPFAQGLALKGIPYTHVSIQGEAAAFADDLRFRTVDVPGMAYADAVVFLRRSRLGLAAALLVVAALSYASGGLTGLLLYGKWKGCASLGLWNLLTFIGLDLAYRRASRREPEKFMGKTGRPAQFLPVFTGVFVLLSVPLGMLLRLPLR